MKSPVSFQHCVMAISAGLSISAHAATVVPITDVFGHNEKSNFGGTIEDMINGSGMNGNGGTGSVTWPTGAGDPATWSLTSPYPSPAYQSEWQAQDLLAGAENPTNGKIGWAVFDLGAVTGDLSKLHIWHIMETSSRVATSFNVYLASAPTVTIPSGPTNNTSIDYNFASGGWTSLSGSPFSGTFQGTSVIDLNGASARYIGIEILSNGGDATRVGFQEVGVSAVPEPRAALLGSIGLLALLRRRR